MPTKAEILKEVTNGYRAQLAADRAKDLRDALDSADETISDKTRLGVAIDDATAAALANDANAKIAAYNAAVVLPSIDVAALATALAGASDA